MEQGTARLPTRRCCQGDRRTREWWSNGGVTNQSDSIARRFQKSVVDHAHMKTYRPTRHHSDFPSPSVHMIASPKSWIEGEAVRQLYATTRLDGMRRVVGFPDLHPGQGTPVGAAFVTEGVIYPHLIGGDIGC